MEEIKYKTRTGKAPVTVTHPQILEEWMEEKNEGIDLDTITAGTNVKGWFKCKKCSYERLSVIRTVCDGSGCPMCAGIIMTKEKSLATLHPKLMEEWDYEHTENKKLDPFLTAPSKGIKVGWICSAGHKYEAKILNRTFRGDACPYCYGRYSTPTTSFAYMHPEIAKHWHPTKNGTLTPDDIKPQSGKKYWWKCPDCNSDYDTTAGVRIRSKKCPFCDGKKVNDSNSLACTSPRIMKLWDYDANTLDPKQVFKNTNTIVHLKCDECGHKFQNQVNWQQLRKNDCVKCANLVAHETNNLLLSTPEIVDIWDYELNDLSPEEVTPKNSKIFNFVCKYGHRYRQSINSKIMRGAGCPHCHNNTLFSKKEKQLLFELKFIFDDISVDIQTLFTSHGNWSADICIPSLKILVEYDGKHWHRGEKSKNKDILKTSLFKEMGYETIRVRENPLPKLQDWDVIHPCSIPISKETVDSLIKNIIENFKLDPEQISKANEYLSSPELQNQQAYLDFLENEKVEIISKKMYKKTRINDETVTFLFDDIPFPTDNEEHYADYERRFIAAYDTDLALTTFLNDMILTAKAHNLIYLVVQNKRNSKANAIKRFVEKVIKSEQKTSTVVIDS